MGAAATHVDHAVAVRPRSEQHAAGSRQAVGVGAIKGQAFRLDVLAQVEGPGLGDHGAEIEIRVLGDASLKFPVGVRVQRSVAINQPLPAAGAVVRLLQVGVVEINPVGAAGAYAVEADDGRDVPRSRGRHDDGGAEGAPSTVLGRGREVLWRSRARPNGRASSRPPHRIRERFVSGSRRSKGRRLGTGRQSKTGRRRRSNPWPGRRCPLGGSIPH